MSLAKNWKIVLLVLFLLLSAGIVGLRGIDFGIDFKGGSLFQIEFSKPVQSIEERVRITQTIQQRIDWTGLLDTTVNFFGDRFAIVQVAETDPVVIERIESLLRRQGKFEVLLDGNVVFTGDDIVEIVSSPTQGASFQRQTQGVIWNLPFVLKSNAAEAFKKASFHQCELVSFDSQAGRAYDCKKTYFFIDRPQNALLVIPRGVYAEDVEKFRVGNHADGQPGGLSIDEVLLNARLESVIADENGLRDTQVVQLQSLVAENPLAIVPPGLNTHVREQLTSLGFDVREQALPENKLQPWLWNAVGLRQIISLTESVANMDVASIADAKTLTTLVITGSAPSLEVAQQRVQDLQILLESGTLSVGVKSISTESITPLLGQEFLNNALLIGLVALLAVAFVIYLRYRVLKLTIPIMFISVAEVFITVAISSLFSKFDLGAVAGIITAVGTGVDDQIVITDELTRSQAAGEVSFVTRIKKAFFVVIASAATLLAVMLPIIIIGFGLGKLVGFAITTVVGVLVGVLITRPAFGELAKMLMERK